MADVGIICSLLFIFDGIIHRFYVDGDGPKTRNGWYVGFENESFTHVLFGTWKDSGVRHVFSSKCKGELTTEEKRKYRMQLVELRKKHLGDVSKKQSECCKTATYIFSKATTLNIGLNEYVICKRIIPYAAKTNERGNLIVPIHNLSGELLSLQFINPDGSKKFLKHTPKKGNCTILRGPEMTLQDTTVVVICEGYATGCSIFQSTGYPTVIAYDAGNLKSVAQAIRNKYPEIQIVIAADDDVETNGNNPGIRFATTAARVVGGALAVPIFISHTGNSDFNDMFKEQGPESVLKQIQAAVESANNPGNTPDDEEPLQAVVAESEMSDNELKGSIATKHFPLVPFPIECLPPYFTDIVNKYSKALQCSPGFMAMNMLTVISGAVGNAVTMAIKSSWQTPPFLWFAVIDISGSGKTHPQEATLSPLRKLQSIEQARFDRDVEFFKKAKLAHDKNKGDNEPAPEEPDQIRHYFTQDFTIEALIPMYRRTTRGIVVYVDELAGLLKGMGQYKSGKNSDDDRMLSLYGCRSIKSDRASKNGFCRESGAAVLGGIQPAIFSTVFTQKEMDNGMLFRYLPMLLNSAPPLFSDDDLTPADEEAWSELVYWMYNVPAKVDIETGCIVKNKLTLTSDARETFRLFHNELSAIQPFMPTQFGGYLSKLKDYCLKFISIIHMIKCREYDSLALSVNMDTVDEAIKLTRYFAAQGLLLVSGSAEDRRNPFHNTLRKSIESLCHEAEGGLLLLSRVRERMNELLPPEMRIEPTHNKRLANWVREIGLTVSRRGDNKSVIKIL